MMKGNKAKNTTAKNQSQNQMSGYELQRYERIKSNAEKMIAKGAGDFATKILQRTQVFNCPNGKQNEELKVDDNVLSSSEYNGGSEEDETYKNREAERNNVAKTKKCPSAPRTMSDFLKMAGPKMQQQLHITKCTSSARKVQEICEKEQQVPVIQKKQPKKVFCVPGSMSKYLELRKKQSEKTNVVEEHNMPLNNPTTTLTRAVHDVSMNDNDNDVGFESEPDDEALS